MTYTIRVLTDVKEDHQVTVTLPPEVPTGPVELVVNVSSPTAESPKKPRTSLAEWADEFAEHWGDRIRSTDVSSFTGRRF
ncbi:MAG: hypothetical protein JXB10_14780 [Pirellulales bacterium]|nr:hypothetical protein [Pirellulales bacterium]